MLVKNLIKTLPLHTKAKDLLDLNTKDFFIRFNSIRFGNYQQKYLEELSHILYKLEEAEVIKSHPTKKSDNGLVIITDIKDEYIISSTKEIILRDRKNIIFIDKSIVSPTSEAVLSSPMPFETYLAMKYLSKQQNALSRGIEFSLTLKDMEKLLKRKRCYYSGLPLELEGDLALTLDRIDSKKGYTADNTVPCCKVINDLKNELIDDGVNIDKVGVTALKKTLKKFCEII